MDVIGVGALNVDLFYKVPSLTLAGHVFEPGEEIVGDEELFTNVSRALAAQEPVARSGGGSAANTVFALSRMGYTTGFLGVTGKDEGSKFLLSSMEGVDVGHVKKYKKAGVCISLLADGERSLLAMPNSNDFFSFIAEDVGYLNSSKFVHLSSFSSDSALLLQKQLLELLEEDVYISFAPGEKYARRGLDQIEDMIGRSRIVFVNEREMTMLTGTGPKEGSKTLLDLGAKVVVCTLGREGSLITTYNSSITVPARKAVVVDTTGAGDVYAAGFLAGYLDGATLEVCGRIGASASALSVSSYGREAYPDERFLRKFAKELD
ncbi:MAG: putative sugar kinase [Methanomassiliicoccales archaeon PtaU1.Bin030]|nr:MAG: putative sugar kinase [Methanomassiliicoccales archaeon PtaU1.Bin030]